MASHFSAREFFFSGVLHGDTPEQCAGALKCSSMFYTYTGICGYMWRSTSAPYCLGLNKKQKNPEDFFFAFPFAFDFAYACLCLFLLP
jgi:hypothetical protein